MLFSPWKIDMEHNEDDNNLDLMFNYHYNNNIMKIIQIAKQTLRRETGILCFIQIT